MDRRVETTAGDHQQELARTLIMALLIARKNFALYPEHHPNSERALQQLQKKLDAYLREYGDLTLQVEKDRLVLQGEVIHRESPEEGRLAFALFRDGIQWLRLTQDIDAEEIREFLRIFNQYRILSEEPDGDLVTALWEARLPHIQYGITDVFWEAETETEAGADFSASESTGEEALDSRDEEQSRLPFAPLDPTAVTLTPEEEAILAEMVAAEEKLESVEEVLDMLVDTLLENREEESIRLVLELLEDEFSESVSRRNFELTLKILQRLRYLQTVCEAESPWASPIVENFFLMASSRQSLTNFQSAWSQTDASHVEKIKEVLLHLNPEAIHTLGPMILQVSSLRLQQMLLEVITVLAGRDLRPLENLLHRSDKELVRRIIPVLGRLDGDRPREILRRLLEAPSARVRREAIKVLLSSEPSAITDLFSFIEDESDAVRSVILDCLGRSRNKVAEDLLLDYLENRKGQRSDDQHILACYRALGRCATPRSVPFLRRALFHKGWLPRFRKSAHRRGAAAALRDMSVPGARETLEEAAHSLYPGVRRAARKVL